MADLRDAGGDFMRQRGRHQIASGNDDERVVLLWLIGMAALIVAGGYLMLARSTGIDQQSINEIAASASQSLGSGSIAATTPVITQSQPTDSHASSFSASATVAPGLQVMPVAEHK